MRKPSDLEREAAQCLAEYSAHPGATEFFARYIAIRNKLGDDVSDR